MATGPSTVTHAARHAHDSHIREATSLVSHLGGPTCSENDIRWAADIPSGQRFLEWLAAQAVQVAGDTFQLPDSVAKQPSGNLESLQDALLRTSTIPIGLYKDETEIVQRLEAQSKSHTAEGSGNLSFYDLPFQLSARAVASEREGELLEVQATRLKHRLSQAKAAAKGLKDAIIAIQAEMQSLKSAKQGREQSLTDLSGEVDDVIGRAERKAMAILQVAERQESEVLPLKREVASLERARVTLSGVIQRLYTSLDDRYGYLPTVDELQAHVSALNAKVAEIKGGSTSVSDLAAPAYVEELERIARRLERNPESIQELIHAPPDSLVETGSRAVETFPNVKIELERAGRLDRIALLRAQERGLDHAMTELQDRLLPRLRRCYDLLRVHAELAAEAESITSVLIEELEEVNDAIQESKRCVASSSPQSENPSQMLEEAVTDALKVLLRSRVDDDGRPTVLLGRADVEAELASLSRRFEQSREAEEKWAMGLRGRLAELTSSHAPLLSAAYQNSPMNTSAPFAPPTFEAKVEQEARHKADSLTQSALQLQKDSELSSKDRRKLTAFVEKWTST
ncbi:hypothetical protein FKP32DRAFT_1724500 [Trametes sanguinea]|nr:hypothetical protein FKP32DRAFT_1724500 [Trametes sanguinea]